jgi:hypothetical protein
LRLARMPAREAMGETAAARYHDFGLLVTLGGPMAEQCLWGGSNLMERAAVHEAGHCVMAWRLGHGIANVVIRSDGSGLATTAPMGVGTAEAVALPRNESACGSRRELSDGRQAVAVAHLLRWPDRKAARELLRVRRHEARLRVNSDAALIKAVAGELLRVGTLTGTEVEAVIYETLRAQWRQRLEKISGIQNQTGTRA